MKRISKIEYQKIVENNKKLLKDIKLLTTEDLSFKKIETIKKWRTALNKVDELKKQISEVLNPVYKKYEYDSDWSMFDNVISRKFGEDEEFIGACWFVESIETNKFLDEDNWNPFNYVSLMSRQEIPLPYDAKFTIDPQESLKFKTKEAAEYFLYHSYSYLKSSCYIKDICIITEHEFINNKI